MFTLQSLCIDLIVEKFERFYFAYTVSRDKNLQRHFELLQRRFSIELLKELHHPRNRKLKEEYFELLINDHLTYLKGKWLKDTRYWNSTGELFRRLPNLTRIRFRYCGDEILENVAKFCPKIIEIDVNDSNVTDNGVKYLCETKNGMAPCPELKRIILEDSDVTNNGIENLIRNLPSLERIDYPNVPLLLHSIHEENVRESENMQLFNLVVLDLSQIELSSNYTDVLKSCLTVCPKLETLGCYILDEEHLNLLNNSHLKKLRLQFCKGDRNINMDKFLKMNGWKLTSLEVVGCSMSVCILGAYCPNLKFFSGHQVKFTDDNEELKLNFPSLIGCQFEDIEPSSNKAVGWLLSSSPKLEAILMKSCELSLDMKPQILLWGKNPCAIQIILIDTLETTLVMEYVKDILLKCPSLKQIQIFNTDVEDFPEEIEETLWQIAESLPNKPLVYLN